MKPRVFKDGRFWRVEYEFGVSPVLHIRWERAIRDAIRYSQ